MNAPIDQALTQLEAAMVETGFPLPEPDKPQSASTIEALLNDRGLAAPHELLAVLSWGSGRNQMDLPGYARLHPVETALKLNAVNRGPKDPPMLPPEWIPVFAHGTYTHWWADTSSGTDSPVALELWAFDEPTPVGTRQTPLLHVVNVMTELLRRKLCTPNPKLPSQWLVDESLFGINVYDEWQIDE